jgi:hypothetical protein
VNLLAAQCAVAQQCIGQDPDTISCKFAADEAFGGGFTPQQFSNGPQRIGDGARDMPRAPMSRVSRSPPSVIGPQSISSAAIPLKHSTAMA